MTTLDALVAALPEHLVPTGPLPRPSRTVGGVHISELLDPTPFLSGGELLLTTGMALTPLVTRLTAYATRLVGAEVTALGFGVGPVHDVVPAALRDACERAGLPLLVVPAATPFQLVVREFWAREGQAERRGLSGALGSTHALLRAVTHDVADRRTARRRVTRTLARSVGGWAAYLDADGVIVTMSPREGGRAARGARVAGAEVHRLKASGPLAGATFAAGGDDVLLQPVGPADGGYLACGHRRPAPTQLRHLVLSACAVLDLQAERLTDAVLAREALPLMLGDLLALGHLDAAADLARARGLAWPDAVRVALVDAAAGAGAPGEGAAPLTRHTNAQVVTLTYPAGADVRAPRDTTRGIVGPPVPARDVAREVARLAATLPTLRPGEWRDAAAPDADAARAGFGAGAALAALSAYDRADLVGTLTAYLRHRGRVEPAAAELGVHRNTMRHRLGLVADMSGVDIDDPDVAAHLWLTLRERGLA